MILGFLSSLCAQQTKKVETSYIYRASENVSVEQAKRIAFERAQIEVLANTFGTRISQQNSTSISNENGRSNVNFLNISTSDIQGEWIETIGEPEYDISYSQEMLIVECHAKGIIRPIKNTPIDVKAKVLRNGITDRFESSEFKSGDDLYVSFQSPMDGYIAIYLMDDNNQAFCLLPYRNQTDGIYKINANCPYLFFSLENASKEEKSIVDEYIMTCTRNPEMNQIYILFSPNKFIKAIDSSSDITIHRTLNGSDFQKWLAKVRRKDTNLTLISTQLIISK